MQSVPCDLFVNPPVNLLSLDLPEICRREVTCNESTLIWRDQWFDFNFI